MCDCASCPIVKDVIPFHEKYTAPASKRAWERTKYDFHAGYSKACEDMGRRMKKALDSAKK